MIPRHTEILIKHAFVSAYASRLTINDSGVTNAKRRLAPSASAVALRKVRRAVSSSFSHVQVAGSPNYSGITDNLGTHACVRARVIAQRIRKTNSIVCACVYFEKSSRLLLRRSVIV